MGAGHAPVVATALAGSPCPPPSCPVPGTGFWGLPALALLTPEPQSCPCSDTWWHPRLSTTADGHPAGCGGTALPSAASRGRRPCLSVPAGAHQASLSADPSPGKAKGSRAEPPCPCQGSNYSSRRRGTMKGREAVGGALSPRPLPALRGWKAGTSPVLRLAHPSCHCPGTTATPSGALLPLGQQGRGAASVPDCPNASPFAWMCTHPSLPPPSIPQAVTMARPCARPSAPAPRAMAWTPKARYVLGGSPSTPALGPISQSAGDAQPLAVAFLVAT